MKYIIARFTAQELIEKLQQVNPQALVYIDTARGTFDLIQIDLESNEVCLSPRSDSEFDPLGV